MSKRHLGLFVFSMALLEARFSQVQGKCNAVCSLVNTSARVDTEGGGGGVVSPASNNRPFIQFYVFFFFFTFQIFFGFFLFLCALSLYRTITDYYY